MNRKKHFGVTLVELMITLVVVGILGSIAIPSFLEAVDNSRLTGAADNLLADMRYAQAEAMKTNAPVNVTFTAGTAWSYTMNTTPNRTTNGSSYSGTRLTIPDVVQGATPPNTLVFDPKRNTVRPAPAAGNDPISLVTITSSRGEIAALEVNTQSAMRLCSTTGFGYYPACN